MRSLLNSMSVYRSRVRQYILNCPILLCLILVTILAFIEMRVIRMIHQHNYCDLIEAAHGVTVGMPHWRAHQNRLLGPSLVKLISHATGLSFPLSFEFFMVLSLIIANLVSFYVFLDLTKNRTLSLKYTFYFALFFLALQHRTWLYLCDFMDIIIFLLFAYGIFKKFNIRYFVYLFIISILNREDALFISLWMIIDSFQYNIEPSNNIQGRRLTIKYYNLLLGVLLTILGIIYIKWIRDTLFIRSMLPRIGLDLNYYIAGGQHFNVLKNIRYLVNFNILQRGDIMVPLVFIFLPIYLMVKMKSDEHSLKVMFLFFCMLFFIFLTCYIAETRVFFILIPFILLLNLKFNGRILKK